MGTKSREVSWDIAAALNKKGIPGPRGVWNASTIAGSRKRLNGILQKNSTPGASSGTAKPSLKTRRPANASAAKIRAINGCQRKPGTFASSMPTPGPRFAPGVKSAAAPRGSYATRLRKLLSGLVKCGCCGSGYVVGGNDKRGPLLLCTRMKETGLCDNRRTIAREAIEALVLKGIEEHLAATEQRQRLDLEAVDALLGQAPSRALRDRLAALEAERDEIEAAICRGRSTNGRIPPERSQCLP